MPQLVTFQTEGYVKQHRLIVINNIHQPQATLFRKKRQKKEIVPHSKSGIFPRLSLSGVGQLGFWEFGKGGTVG